MPGLDAADVAALIGDAAVAPREDGKDESFSVGAACAELQATRASRAALKVGKPSY
jgi:hypothetical protein